MMWNEASDPPGFEVETDFGAYWLASKRVLVVDKSGYMTVATYEQVDCDTAPKWYSGCSERWELKNITHWMWLPDAP